MTNIRPAEKSIIIRGVGKGEIVAKLVGDFFGLGTVYFHPDCIANILCFFDMQRKFNVKFENNNFILKTNANDPVLVFKPYNKLYIADINHIIKTKHIRGHVNVNYASRHEDRNFKNCVTDTLLLTKMDNKENGSPEGETQPVIRKHIGN